ncbi:MAG TPA: hypothetical protein VHK67_04465 [Rhabdochlamydiaceae bacterium]|jgi:hypothetical protein|nr:hypothetical protein [Rhabdochlamydiaceae bacterium]
MTLFLGNGIMCDMPRKKPFFLLEIVIAIFLVGLFSSYFLRSSIKCLHQERQALLDLEFERLYDLKRMELIVSNWHKVDQLPAKGKEAKEEKYPFEVILADKSYLRSKTFQVFCPKKHETAHILCIREGKKNKHYFLVRKVDAKT